MKCSTCGGHLEGTMTFCPFCGVRQDIDLRQIHFRDLGADGSMPCPGCESSLTVIEFETQPPIRIERCNGCHGMFFNPGELEALLDVQTNPLVWLDTVQMEQIGTDYGFSHEVIYRKCPLCSERMGHLNFAGRSGVVLDRCGIHGVWVEGGELRRLTEWWRAGGKLVFQQHEAAKTKRLFQEPKPERVWPGTIEPADKPQDWTWTSTSGMLDASDLLAAAVETIVSVISD